MEYREPLTLDIYNYSRECVCPLYDSESDTTGQAFNVFIKTERNGWKELSFNLPTKCQSANGEEDNFRLAYLKNDYKIRSYDGKEVDWFIVDQEKVTHEAYSRNISGTAGHVSQLLNMKKLDLEFSDTEGNNTGTASELLTTILDGTGWTNGYVYSFAEDDGRIKRRSLKAGVKTGAFKLISKMCDLFDAKPVYHGDSKTVDILPMNPFSEPEVGHLPDVSLASNVVELHYGTNLSNVTRTTSSKNIVTKFYAHGAYGEKTYGYCSIDECGHTVFEMKLTESIEENRIYYFRVTDDSGTEITRHFTAKANLAAGDVLLYSLLDPTSMMYVWDPQNELAYYTEQGAQGNELQMTYLIDQPEWTVADTTLSASCRIFYPEEKQMVHVGIPDVTEDFTVTVYILNEPSAETRVKTTKTRIGNGYADDIDAPDGFYVEIAYNKKLNMLSEEQKLLKAEELHNIVETAFFRNAKKNWFSFLTDYSYFRGNGLLTDEMLDSIAAYQQEAPEYYEAAYESSMQYSEDLKVLRDQVGAINFVKLDVLRTENSENSYEILVLDKSTYKDGVIYRTDFDALERNYFEWHVADRLDKNGDPVTGIASIVYILHDTDPITWDKAYLKEIDDEDSPTKLTLWAAKDTMRINLDTDRFYLFEYNGINGYLGAYEAMDEAAVQSIESTTRTVTVNHPVYFGETEPVIAMNRLNGYSWYWKYDPTGEAESVWYFAYPAGGDSWWHTVVYANEEPDGEAGDYWYNWQESKLYRYSGESWNWMETFEETRISNVFGSVYALCKNRDRYYQGLSKEYFYGHLTGVLPQGNYYIDSGYELLWLFTTTADLQEGDSLIYIQKDNEVLQNTANVQTSLDAKAYGFTAVTHHADNIYTGVEMESGTIAVGGEEADDPECCRTISNISVYPGVKYSFSGFGGLTCIVAQYNSLRKLVGDGYEFTDSGILEMNALTKYIRIYAILNEQIPNAETFNSAVSPMIQAVGYETDVVVDDVTYHKLPAAGRGENIGILSSMQKFAEYADKCYDVDAKALKEAQDTIKTMETNISDMLGDLVREGYWQDSSYVDGDEKKLYDDALKKLKVAAKPEVKYTIKYIPVHAADPTVHAGLTEETTSAEWPDISTESAVHLVDPEIAINTWAYVDKVEKCYDVPKNTKISINTDLTTMNQHTFADVLSNIADVATEARTAAERGTSVGTATSISAATPIVASQITNITQAVNNALNEIGVLQTTVQNTGGTNVSAMSSGDGRNIVYYSDYEPVGTFTVGDIWYQEVPADQAGT